MQPLMTRAKFVESPPTDKFVNMKQQVQQRFQHEEQDLMKKYASKFNIFPPVPAAEPFRRTRVHLKELYAKLK